MAKGRIGMSGSDRGLAQIEKDLRDMRRSGEGSDRSTGPTTLKEQIEHAKYLETFPGRYPNYGSWEQAVNEECRELRIPLTLLSEIGYYPRMWKEDGYAKEITPKAFSRTLREKLNY
jgi:hypothetical protein